MQLDKKTKIIGIMGLVITVGLVQVLLSTPLQQAVSDTAVIIRESAGGSGNLTGTCNTPNKLTKWNTNTTIGCAVFSDDGFNIYTNSGAIHFNGTAGVPSTEAWFIAKFGDVLYYNIPPPEFASGAQHQFAINGGVALAISPDYLFTQSVPFTSPDSIILVSKTNNALLLGSAFEGTLYYRTDNAYGGLMFYNDTSGVPVNVTSYWRDEGVFAGTQVAANCVGSGITCTVDQANNEIEINVSGGGGSGNVTGNGITDRLAKWTSTTNLGNALISDDGSTLLLLADLDANSNDVINLVSTQYTAGTCPAGSTFYICRDSSLDRLNINVPSGKQWDFKVNGTPELQVSGSTVNVNSNDLNNIQTGNFVVRTTDAAAIAGRMYFKNDGTGYFKFYDNQGSPALKYFMADIQDEGTFLASQPRINFNGTGISCTNESASLRVTCAISGVSGSGVSGRVTIWDGTSSITSDAEFLYDSSTNILTVSTIIDGSGDPADTGFIEVGNAVNVFCAESSPTGADNCMQVDANENLLYDSDTVSTGSTLVASDTEDQTKTNIGASYVDIYTTDAGEANQEYLVNCEGKTQVRLVVYWNKIGAGTQDFRVVDQSNNSNVLSEDLNIATGKNDEGWESIPSWCNGEFFIESQARSSTAADDPVLRAYMVYLR